MNLEIVLMWVAVGAYALSSILFIVGTVFGRSRMNTAGLVVATAGLVAQAVAIADRWIRVGHAPYLGFYEVVSAYAFATVMAFVIIAWARPALRSLGLALMPMAFLAIGASMFADKGAEVVTGALASWWLTIHVLFAKLSYSSFVVAFALAAVYLLRLRNVGSGTRAVLDKLPSQEVVDSLSFQFIGVGTVFLAIMIAAGSVWANEAWGRYWAWDPIETWSLIAWLVYAIYLHLRLTMGWQGKRAAWVAVAALPVVAFSFVVVPVLYNSIHGAYLQGM